MELIKGTQIWAEAVILAAEETIEKYTKAIADLDKGTQVLSVGYKLSLNSVPACAYCTRFMDRSKINTMGMECNICPQYQEPQVLHKYGKEIPVKRTRCLDHVTYKKLYRYQDIGTKMGVSPALSPEDYKKALVNRIGYHKRMITRMKKKFKI